jgi:toxin YoeB
MTSLSASQARANLFKLMEQAATSHEPIQINGRHRSAVLVSEEDWRAMRETLYLLSVPGMRESIRKGLKTPLAKTSKLAAAGLRPKAEMLLALLAEDPFRNPPPYQKLIGDLDGAYSRRINIQHRLVYQVLKPERVVKVLRLWTHYE